MSYLVFWHNGAKIGAILNTPTARADAFRALRLSPLSVDISGCEHFTVLGVAK